MDLAGVHSVFALCGLARSCQFQSGDPSVRQLQERCGVVVSGFILDVICESSIPYQENSAFPNNNVYYSDTLSEILLLSIRFVMMLQDFR